MIDDNSEEQSELMKMLRILEKVVAEPKTPAHVVANIYLTNGNWTSYAPKSKDDFLSKIIDMSLAYHIVYVRCVNTTSASGNFMRIDMDVYVEKSSDNTSNISANVIEVFSKLPIVPLPRTIQPELDI